jgi:HEPN domain-containing protein
LSSLHSIWEWLRRQKTRVCGKRPVAESKDRLRTEYIATGLRYHIAARYSAAAWFSPTAGNLAHHAIEFYLKGALIERLDEDARRKFRHNLPKLWRRYKRDRKNPALNKFDQTIRDINKFERIRYPEEIFRGLGMSAVIGFAGSSPPSPGEPGARYLLALDEVDELVKLLFQIERLNPQFFVAGLNKHAKRYLDHENRHPL